MGVAQGVLRGVGILFATIMVVVTVALLGWAVLVMLLAGSAGYNEPMTAGGWMRELASSARVFLIASAVVTVALVIAGSVFVVAAYRRRTGWIVVGGVCSGLLAIALVGVAAASSQVETLAARAVAAVGNVSAVEPRPVDPPAPDPITVTEARADMEAMLQLTVGAAREPVRDADGAPVTVDPAAFVAAPCGEIGTRYAASLDLATADNEASMRSILAVWDDAGYLADRAMQLDIRYSTTRPVERMTIRDTSSIDGLVHVTVETACAVE